MLALLQPEQIRFIAPKHVHAISVLEAESDVVHFFKRNLPSIVSFRVEYMPSQNFAAI